MISANLCIVSTGTILGWTSPVLPKLSSTLDDNPLGVIITEEESTWIASLVAIGAMVGSFIAGYLAERYSYIREEFFSSALDNITAQGIRVHC